VKSIFFQPGPFFSKRDHFFPSDRYVPIRRSRHPVYSCSFMSVARPSTALCPLSAALSRDVTGSGEVTTFQVARPHRAGRPRHQKVLQFVMMTLKISVFRILFFISPSINPNVLCFIQMSSSDDEAQSPDIGASGPKGSPPPLQSESADDEDLLPKTKRKKGHRRPRIAIMRGRNHGRGCDKAADTHRVQVR
jgi:hypothetical protein